jgi:hypothetical protein
MVGVTMECPVYHVSCNGGEHLYLHKDSSYAYTDLCLYQHSTARNVKFDLVKPGGKEQTLRLTFWPSFSYYSTSGRFSCVVKGHGLSSTQKPTTTTMVGPAPAACSYSPPSAVKCGVKGPRYDLITNGKPAEEAEFPWMAALHSNGTVRSRNVHLMLISYFPI